MWSMFIQSILPSAFLLYIAAQSANAATVNQTRSSPSPRAAQATNCFPLGTAKLSGTTKPSQTRNDWWCGTDLQYGFMGFSYPLESPNCNDVSNSLSKINADFARMKNEFGATMVRIYAPECRDKSIWITLLKAGIQNNMAVLPQVWWGFEDQSLWKKTKAAILATFEDATYGAVAPYVFHSIAFGSEPIGDFVDDGNFVNDLKAMKTALQPYGVPITISEDWDRPGRMSNSDFTGLVSLGSQIAAVIDLVHVHIMPYYHADRFPTASNIWPYFQSYIPFLEKNLPNKPILISQTLWTSAKGGSHGRGFGEPGENLGNFTQYWTTIENQCSYFKSHKVGWFVHAYDDSFENFLGMIDESGNTKFAFKPPKC